MTTKFQLTTLRVASLEVCDRVRVRDQKPKDGSDIVIEYAEAYRRLDIKEPLDVFRDPGTERYIVADGEHRLLALRRAKMEHVECRLHAGDETDALEFGLRCNQAHGLRRTKGDIYHAFRRVQETPRLQAKYRTDSQLMALLGVSASTIARYKIDWRNSEGGNARVSAAKRDARESAAAHDPRRGNLSLTGSSGRQNQGLAKNQLASGLPEDVPENGAGGSSSNGATDDYLRDDIDAEARDARAEREYQASIEKVMGADDKLTAAHEEIRRQAAEIGILKISRDGYLNKCGELVRRLKAEQAKGAKQRAYIEELKGQLAGLRADNQALQRQLGSPRVPVSGVTTELADDGPERF